MKIALFGANSSICKELKPMFEKISEVTTIGRSNSDIIIDLSNTNSEIDLPNGFDAIIHTSAYFGSSNLEGIYESINVNLIGTLKLFDASIAAGIKHFIYISSIYSHLKSDSSLYSIYSLTKKWSEEVLMLYVADKDIKLTILKPSPIYGNYKSNRQHQPFFYSIIDKIKNNQNVTFYGNRDPKRNFIHIEDLCTIIFKTVIYKIGGEFDCANPKNITFIDIANAAKIVFKSNSEIIFDTSKDDITDLEIDFKYNLYELIDFQPKISIQEGINKIKILPFQN